MFKKRMLIISIMIVASPFTYAMDPDDKEGKPDALHLARGGGKKYSSGGSK